MDRLALGHDGLARVNERIVYCSITGYGASGPLGDQAGHDITYVSLSGMLPMSGGLRPDPVPPPTQIADVGGDFRPVSPYCRPRATIAGCRTASPAMCSRVTVFSLSVRAYGGTPPAAVTWSPGRPAPSGGSCSALAAPPGSDSRGARRTTATWPAGHHRPVAVVPLQPQARVRQPGAEVPPVTAAIGRLGLCRGAELFADERLAGRCVPRALTQHSRFTRLLAAAS